MATVAGSVGFISTLRSACPLGDARSGPAARDLRTHRLPRVSCEQRGEQRPSRLLLDRRDMLLGLGGLYGAAGQMALADPVMPPDIGSPSSCHTATDPNIPPDSPLLKCCPPYQGTEVGIKEYTFPRTTLRERRAAHLAVKDEEYVAKYSEAIDKMKKLPNEDPRNFYQQAKIHCAFCNEAYDQVGYVDVPLQVHGSWLFLPWHRYYLHFYERILGKLIDDDTFALPFWNFDHPDGMEMPSIFLDPASPLYNPSRDTNHFPPAIVDYKYGYSHREGSDATGSALVQANLDYMRKVFNESKTVPELFLGDPAKAGDKLPVVGSKATGGLETIHNAFHQWVGPPEKPYTDMGSFATAARDCMFYCLHSNVDRLWSIYSNLRGNKVEFTDPDWLDATFIFYDEDGDVVKVKVRDSLTTAKFCYTYETRPLPWLTKPKVKKTAETKTKKQLSLVPVGDFGTAPRALTEPIRALVPRPKKNRSPGEKEEKAELLFIKNIQFGKDPARFDVYVAKPYGDLAGPDYGEFVGSFVKLPDEHGGTSSVRRSLLKLGITYVLDEIDAESSDKLVVTLVPSHGDVTIGGIQIKLVATDVGSVAI